MPFSLSARIYSAQKWVGATTVTHTHAAIGLTYSTFPLSVGMPGPLTDALQREEIAPHSPFLLPQTKQGQTLCGSAY